MKEDEDEKRREMKERGSEEKKRREKEKNSRCGRNVSRGVVDKELEKKGKKKKTNEKVKGMNKSKITNEGTFVMKNFFSDTRNFAKILIMEFLCGLNSIFI